MKNTYYTIFALSYMLPYVVRVRDIAYESVTGRRNQLEAVPKILKASLFGGYHYSIGMTSGCWKQFPYITDKIRRGDIIYRLNGRNLGCARFCDYRQILDCVAVENVTKNSVIGTRGERVRPEQIICVCREGV